MLNPFSWNNEASILFIDQPVGVGFSHGDTSSVGTSQEAAADIWTFMQILFSDSRFSKYQTNNLAIWTESYGNWLLFHTNIYVNNEIVMAGIMDRLLLRESCNPVPVAYV